METNMHKVIILSVVFVLVGCSGNPAPEEAIKECLNNGGTPDYFSNVLRTQFICQVKTR